MKKIKYTITLLFILASLLPSTTYSQVHSDNELAFEINRIHTPLSISKETLKNAQTLSDLNKNYKPSWVKEYQSVEVSIIQQGKIIKAIGKNANLTKEQKDNMQMVDPGTDIAILVKYIPENTLQSNEIKEHDFSFLVNPENEAKYIGGAEQLNQYLKQHAIDNIPNGCFNGLDLAAVKFTIDEAGNIVNTHVFESSSNEDVDQLLMTALNNMPNWKPAEYADGTKISQEFVLTVGNMKNCIVNLLNIN